MKRLYIEERKSDWSGKKEKIVEQAYYGPFEESELEERLNDELADFLAGDGNSLDAIVMTDDEAKRYYINSREFWMSQLAKLQE